MKFYFILFVFLFAFNLQIIAEKDSKPLIAESILDHLNSSAQFQENKWEFSFSKNQCTFYKQQFFYARDGFLISKQTIEIPLVKTELEIEQNKYDSFFTCNAYPKACIIHSWEQTNQSTSKKPQSFEIASLFIKDIRLAKKVLRQFQSLQDLCNRKNYQGPINIEWGDSAKIVLQKIPKRFKFIEEELNNSSQIQKYNGIFAEKFPSNLFLHYINEQFYELEVIVEQSDSILKTWLEIVDSMIFKYGTPDRISLPFKIKNFNELYKTKDINYFQKLIPTLWKPIAVWSFKNDVDIQVAILNKIGKQQIVWKFYHKKLHKVATNKKKQQVISDF